MSKSLKLMISSLLLLTVYSCTVTSEVKVGGVPSGSSTSPSPSSAQVNPSGSASPSTPQAQSSVTPSTSNSINNLTENEPNNDFAKANSANVNFVITGAIKSTEDDERDFFSIAIPAGVHDGILKFTLKESSADFTPHFTLFNSARTELDNKYVDDGTTSPFIWAQAVTAGKSYYLRLDNPPAVLTNYSLVGEFVPVPDTFEPNNTFEEAKSLDAGKPVDLYMFSGFDTLDGINNDVDFFKVTVPSGKNKVKVAIENKSKVDHPQNFHVTIFDNSKTDLDNKYGSNDQANFSESFNVSGSGTYYLKLSNISNSVEASKLVVTFE